MPALAAESGTLLLSLLMMLVLSDSWSASVAATLVEDTIYITGGEPANGFHCNTEDVVMKGKIRLLAK